MQSDTTTQSPLLNLPAELRNQIYSHVLVSPEDLEINKANITCRLPLLGACKQVRKGAGPIFYVENTFRITCPVAHAVRVQPAKNWLENIGSPASIIQSLRFRIELCGCQREMFQELRKSPDGMRTMKPSGRKISLSALIWTNSQNGITVSIDATNEAISELFDLDLQREAFEIYHDRFFEDGGLCFYANPKLHEAMMKIKAHLGLDTKNTRRRMYTNANARIRLPDDQ